MNRRGVASAEPDLVVLSFNVVGGDPSYSAAVEELNGRVEALRTDLEAAGVERSRLKTRGFDVNDERRYDSDTGESVFVGYEASHGLRRRAMRAAVEDVQESARVLAETSGATLGEIVSVDYSFVEVQTRRFTYAQRLRGRLMADPLPAPDVEPETLDAQEGVMVLWEIS